MATPNGRAAFRLAPHIIIDGVGPTLCNCHASDVDGAAAYQLYENDSPQTYSIVNSYLSAKKRITTTKPRSVRDPDSEPSTEPSAEPSADEASEEDAWALVEAQPQARPSE